MFDDLHPLDLDAPAFYPEQEHTGRDLRVTLREDRTHRRHAAKRTTLDMTRVANAARQLDRLPDAGESIHGIMRCNFDAFEFVPAVLALAYPATITELNIATLGFNDRNTDALLALMDSGEVGRTTFICSHFYRSHEGEVYDRLHAEFARRGCPCVAIRCHAKILGIELSDGRCFTLEMSANLRSCRNLEQFVMTHDAGLLRFHRGWMNDLFQEAQA